MRKMRNFPEFTHFSCLPFIAPQHRHFIKQLQTYIEAIVHTQYPQGVLNASNSNLAHVTICMLVLHRQETKRQMLEISEGMARTVQEMMAGVRLAFSSVEYFTRFNHKTKQKEVTLVYLELEKNQHYQKVVELTDMFVRQLLKRELVTSDELKSMRIAYDHNSNLFKVEQHHLTLFRVKGIEDNAQWQECFKKIQKQFKPVTFPCQLFDISTRDNFREETSFYTPLHSIPLKYEQ